MLVDSVAKKVRFLSTVAAATGLDRRVAAVAERASWPAVTARAVAPLAELIELALPLLRPAGILVAWKRGSVDAAGLGGEIAAGRRALAAIDPAGRIEILPTPAESRSMADGAAGLGQIADHRLVIVERGPGRIAASWPRDPTTRRRQPAGEDV